MTSKVQLVGLVEKRYRHPGAGRYYQFARRLGLGFVRTFVPFRFFSRPWLNKVDQFIWAHGSNTHYPYSFGLFCQELAVLIAMVRSPDTLFHFVKGEVDVHHVPRWTRGRRVRVVATFHHPPEFGELEDKVDSLLRKLDGVVVLAETQKRALDAVLDPARVRVVHHGVDTEFFRPATAPTSEERIISVGSFARDHQLMNEAMRRVWAVRPTATFLIVGTGTRSHERSPLTDARAIYIDNVSDQELLHLYQSCSVAALPVWAATANNALLEAMSCGVPIVAPDIGGLREYLGDQAGVLVTPSESAEFADAILTLLSDPRHRAILGRAGRDRAVSQFDYEVVAKEMSDFYRDILSWPQAQPGG